MSDNDDDFDPELLIQEITQSVDCEQDNDPLNRIVTVEIDMFAQRLEDGFITRYNTKCPTAQIKFRDVNPKYHRIVD
jgi:hypothetical protein